jgi:asparagine synthase (glutamine-hydrolysing)
VPIGFCLSGGIDSTSLVSIAKKIFNKNINTYSIIDKSDDYNETKNIDYVIKDLNIKNKKITFNKKYFIKNLTKLIKYRQMPVLTISYYVHSQISKIAKKDGVKILISGTGADEIFSGYYDHYILDIIQNKNDKKKLNSWQKFVKPNVKNPIFNNIEKFKKNCKNYSYIFDNKNLIDPYILKPTSIRKFKPHFFCKDILKNRMLNELFYESVPVILFEDDQNSMQNSIENRSPFLDKELIEYLYSISSKNYIQNGYNKFLLRSSMKNILIDKVRLDRRKVGFNFDINNLIDFNEKKNIDFLLQKKSNIFKYVKRKKIEKLISENKINENYLKKFIFSFISTKIFLDNCV